MNNQNLIHDITDLTDESGVTEPVTLQEMKDYMRLEGFVDSDDSTTESLSNFSLDDDFIEDLITAARSGLEEWCGVSIVQRTLKVTFENQAGDIEIPYGPIQSITSLKYKKNDVEVDSENYETTGFSFLTIDTTFTERMYITYEAGYEDVPKKLRLAIMQCVAYWYENRTVGTIPELALNTAREFKRAWTWLA